MSREQWGHGYWNGVRDERNGVVPNDVDIEALSRLAISKLKELDNGSNVDVSRAFIIFCLFGNLSETLFTDIYEYILTHPGTDGCRISGGKKTSYKDDVFVFD